MQSRSVEKNHMLIIFIKNNGERGFDDAIRKINSFIEIVPLRSLEKKVAVRGGTIRNHPIF